MKILVCGGRDFNDYSAVDKVLEERNKITPISLIIQGGAKGADSLAWDWAYTNQYPCVRYPALWKKHGKAAGYIRNKQMLDEGKPDLVIAFPGGPGTAMMIKLAEEAGIPVEKY